MRRARQRLGLLAAICGLATLSLAPAATADITVGQVFAPDVTPCSAPFVALQTGITSGPSYTVPTAGTITSWSFQLGAAALPDLKLKVGRPAGGTNYLIVGESAAGTQVPSSVNTYPTSIPVQAGDLIGIYANPTGLMGQSCVDYTGNNTTDTYVTRSGDLAPGSQDAFNPNLPQNAARYPVQANLVPAATSAPSNAFSFGKLKRNRNKGTAKLTVNVPGPGTLNLSGKGLVKQRPGAAASKNVSAAGAVKLRIKAKGKKKKGLNQNGKVKVKANVTYTPTGGSPNSKVKKVKLKKTL